MKVVLCAPVFLLLASAAVVRAAEKPGETAAIEGLVVASGSGEPLKKARVFLHSLDRDRPLAATTDAGGKFTLKNIEPGRYRLSAERDGYIGQDYGQRGPRGRGGVLTLAREQHLRDVVFRLVAAAVIAGRVLDADQEPLTGATVQVARFGYVGGQRQLVPAGQGTTNDLGEYRLHGLAPGRYFVSAVYGSNLMDEAYAPTFYPSVNDPARAMPVEAIAGNEMRGIDIRLLVTRTVRVRGKVLNAATGRVEREVMVWLSPRDAGGGLVSQQRAFAREGSFEIRGVAPGAYTLLADSQQEGQRYSGRQRLEVTGSNLEDVNLVLTPGVQLAGRVRLEGNGKLNIQEVRVQLQPLSPHPMGGTGAPVNPDGSFRIPNVTSENYQIVLSGAPEDFYLQSARLGSQDVLEAGLDLSRGEPGGLDLVLNSGGGRIDGVVLSEKQEPLGGVEVVLVPESRRRQQLYLYKNVMTDENGRFAMRGVAPGEYKVFAWDQLEPGAYNDPQFLQTYEERGEAVVVQAQGSKTVTLPVIRTESAR